MQIRDFFKLWNEFNDDVLSIGEMLEKISSFGDDEKIEFSNGLFFDGDYGSYRGFFEGLYLGCDIENKGFNTIGHLKETLNKALNDGIMKGYKGGEFIINKDTFVWFASEGERGEMICDIQKIEGEIFVIVRN